MARRDDASASDGIRVVVPGCEAIKRASLALRDRAAAGQRGVAALCATAVGLLAFVSGVRADGDPASDDLVARQVFVSSQEVGESPA
ncbi:MAG: hypothetical protein WBP81_10230 [Solirubrobacteraceae bacterium]